MIMSFVDDSLSSDASDSEKEAMKALRLKKGLLEKENEMAMKMLLGSSTDVDNGKEYWSLSNKHSFLVEPRNATS
jgi:hypothetical protein